MGFEFTTLVEIGTDSTGSCKSNYHMITTTTAPSLHSAENHIYMIVYIPDGYVSL
jgi:hypothetical protein